MRATAPVRDGRSRVTALSSAASDAVEKPSRVHPDGEEVVRTLSVMLADASSLDVEFPPEALAGSAAAEHRIYPSLLAHVFESVESVLERPHGCAEQTLSAAYPSLLLLRYEKAGGRVPQAVTERARRYLALGYERLLGFQVPGGGFSYWGHGDDADVALTAYALRFLDDARGFVAVDDDVPDGALHWLLKQQGGRGR